MLRRIIVLSLLIVLIVDGLTVRARTHPQFVQRVAPTPVAATVTVFGIRDIPHAASRSEVRKPKPHVVAHHKHRHAVVHHRRRRHSTPTGCTRSNWRSTMTSAEVWIDTHESSLNPYARNGQYWGLGQLGPSYAWTSDPCQQLRDQRDYIAHRYGSEWNAVAFWRAHNWY